MGQVSRRPVFAPSDSCGPGETGRGRTRGGQPGGRARPELDSTGFGWPVRWRRDRARPGQALCGRGGSHSRAGAIREHGWSSFDERPSPGAQAVCAQRGGPPSAIESAEIGPRWTRTPRPGR